MTYKIPLFFLFSWWIFNIQCNLLPTATLFEKKYNEVAYATTHNGQSHLPSLVQNQDLPIIEQLKSGIRAIKIPVWHDCNKDGKYVLFACHGISKELLRNVYLGSLISRIPWVFKPFARKIYNQIYPVDSLVEQAINYAYGKNDNESGILPFHHSICDPAGRPLADVFKEIRFFLETNPEEVITLILEDFTFNRVGIAMTAQESGLLPYIYTQDIHKSWATLGDMVAQGKRLVLFVRNGDQIIHDSYPWLHNLWEFAWDTRWDFKKIRDFKKDIVPNRGKLAFMLRDSKPNNKLFIVYHFITPIAGGSKRKAMRANRTRILRNRMQRLTKETGHMPNFIQVDFFEYPHTNIIALVNELNSH